MTEASLVFEFDEQEALAHLNRWGGRPLPISASFWSDGILTVRLSGALAAVAAAREKLGGELLPLADAFWRTVREQRQPAFAGDILWRLALPSTAAPFALPGCRAIEWGGAQRWLVTDANVETVREAAREAGGHAVLYRAPESLRCLEGAFAPLSPALLGLHRRLKKAFDPKGIFNPGRLYTEL